MAAVSRDYASLIKQYRSGSLSIAEFCKKHDIASSTFQYHLYKPRSSKKHASTPKKVSRATSDFIAISPRATSERITLWLPGGIEIHIPVSGNRP